MDNGWAISLLDIPLSEFNKSIVQFPSKNRFPGGASNDMLPNLQNPAESAALRSDQNTENHRSALNGEYD